MVAICAYWGVVGLADVVNCTHIAPVAAEPTTTAVPAVTPGTLAGSVTETVYPDGNAVEPYAVLPSSAVRYGYVMVTGRPVVELITVPCGTNRKFALDQAVPVF